MSQSLEDNPVSPASITMVKKPRKSKGITPIIKKSSFPDYIQKKALEIYDTLDVENHKSAKKKRLACYCVHQAYVAHKKPWVNVIEIGKRLEMTPMESRNAVSTKPAYKKGFAPYDAEISQEDVIFHYITETCNLGESDANEIIKDFKTLLTFDPELTTKQSQTVIAAYLMYWMPLNSFVINEKNLAEDFGLVRGTVNSMCNDIKKSVARM